MKMKCMASKKHDQKPRQRVQVSIRIQLAEQAEQLAEKLATDITEIANMALREKLEREGFWPPQPKQSSDN